MNVVIYNKNIILFILISTALIISLHLEINNDFLFNNFLDNGRVYSFDSVISNVTQAEDSKKASDFTLFIYMIGSTLEDETYEASNDIKEMLNVTSFNPNVNIILETGGSKAKFDANRVIDFSSVKRHIIYNKTIVTKEHLNPLVNMGDNQTLLDFINWGLDKFPAKKYGLILWDHGGSYTGFGKDMNFGKDNMNPEGGDGLTMSELEHALSQSNINNLSTNNEFELIGFDACLMGSIEVADRIVSADMEDNRTNIKYMVASEEIEPNWGWNYTFILDALNKEPTLSGDVLGTGIVRSYEQTSKNISDKNKFYAYRDITLSVLDLTKIKEVSRGLLSDLSLYLLEEFENPDSVSRLLNSIEITEHYGKTPKESFGIIDFISFLTNIGDTFPTLKDMADLVKENITSAIIYNHAGESHPNANGISYYFPITEREYEKGSGAAMGRTQWLAMSDFSAIYLNDENRPIINSERNGTQIVVKTDDMVKNVYTDNYFDVNKSSPLVFTQELDTSVIKNPNNFVNTPGMSMGLCNEETCIPATMTMYNYKDIQRLYMPVKIITRNGSDIRTTLMFDVENNNSFFLGGISDGEKIKAKGDQAGGTFTLSKQRINLHEGDVIYTQGYKPLKYNFIPQSEDELSKEIAGDGVSKNGRFDSYKENDVFFLNVTDPFQVKPKLRNFHHSAIQYILCDYSELCGKSRVYNLNMKDDFVIYKNNSNLSSFVTDQGNQNNDQKNSPPLYVNQEHDFQLKLPSSPWITYTSKIDDKVNKFFFSDSIDTILFPLTGISEKSSFPIFTTRIEVDDSKYSSTLDSKFDYFMKVIGAPPGKLNSTHNDINGYPAFEIEYRDGGSTIYIVSVEMNKKIYTFFSIIDLIDKQYLQDLKQSIKTLEPNQFKNIDVNKLNHKFVNQTFLINEIETLRQDYLLTHLTSIEYFNDSFNFTMSYPSFGNISQIDRKALQTLDNVITLELPQVHITNYYAPYISIYKTDPVLFKEMKKLSEITLKGNEVSSEGGYIYPIEEELNRYLLTIERFGYKTPNRENIYTQFFRVNDTNRDIPGLLTEYKYYDSFFSEIVHRKTVSFIISNDDHLAFELTTRLSDFPEYEPLFDAMMLSLKFH